MTDAPCLQRSAKFSRDGLYRYRLERAWGAAPKLAFVMLNPSTADASQDDPTIRRAMGFARREGAGGFVVVNLFAFRATDPRDLVAAADPVGRGNARALGLVLREARQNQRPLICAWGAHPLAEAAGRGFALRAARSGVTLACLGCTKAGQPRHPLYLPLDALLQPWESGARPGQSASRRAIGN